MIYSVSMLQFQRLKKLILAATAVLLACACGMTSTQNKASDIAEEFYAFQLAREIPFPSDLFSSSEAAVQAESLLQRRETAFGPYLSSKRTGINRRVSFGKNGKEESITYTYEVTGENGKTRETLMLSRNQKAESFLISAYIIENIPQLKDPAPAGTSST